MLGREGGLKDETGGPETNLSSPEVEGKNWESLDVFFQLPPRGGGGGVGGGGEGGLL